MAFGIDFPEFGSANPYTGTTPYTAIDTFNAALENNGASQLIGSLYQAPLVPTSSLAAGGGLNGYFKYVRYNPTASQVIQAGPALVYWKDETFTTVTPLYSESYLAANPSSAVAGWLLYNTTSVPGATAAAINGNFAWIAVGGFVPGAFVTAAATVGLGLYGGTGGVWTTTNTASTPARLVGINLTVAASNLADIYVPFLN